MSSPCRSHRTSSHDRRRPSRREFLRASAILSLAWAAGIHCQRDRGTPDGIARVIESVRQYHRDLGGLPDAPVAVAYDPAIEFYPSIHDVAGFAANVSDVYSLVARALMLLAPDQLESPLAGLVRPGDTVVIKPNWSTQYAFPFPITHPSVVLPLIEMAARAGAARIRIVEAPMTLSRGCDWYWSSAMTNATVLAAQQNAAHGGTEIEFVDGNADDFLWVDVGAASELRDYEYAALDHDGHTGFEKDMFFDVADSRGHNPGRYTPGLAAIAKSYLDCDVFINVPKLKVHGYTGITAAIKNLMGLNLRSTVHKMAAELVKDYEGRPDFDEWRESPMRDIPHFDGTKTGGFGEMNPRKKLYTGFKNDVLWRTLADLNKIILYADAVGTLHDSPQRRYLTVVDGVVGIEREGPISDHIVQSKCIVAGQDPVRVDAVCSHVMGWDARALNLITNCDACSVLPIGGFDGYEASIVGEPLDSACFAQHYVPPSTYRDEIIAPHTVFRR